MVRERQKFFFSVPGFEFRAFTLIYSTCPFFVMGVFKIESHKLFCLGCLQTSILLISAS
jgi:hypothetical protein